MQVFSPDVTFGFSQSRVIFKVPHLPRPFGMLGVSVSRSSDEDGIASRDSYNATAHLDRLAWTVRRRRRLPPGPAR
jgi:hypothetical protein